MLLDNERERHEREERYHHELEVDRLREENASMHVTHPEEFVDIEPVQPVARQIDHAIERSYQEVPQHVDDEKERWASTHVGTIFAAIAIIAIVTIIPIVIVFMPKPNPYHQGPFQAGNIHVVDSVSGDDVSMHVDHYAVWVTNDTSDLNAYWWINNATIIQGIHDVLASIDPELQYKAVVMETFGLPSSLYNGSYSMDIIMAGDNYIWLPLP